MEPIRTMKCPDIEPGDLFTEGVVVERSHFHVIVDLPVGVGSSRKLGRVGIQELMA